ncbi:sn1-specific diacylglycerol lipase beta [Reticulomyxa filosa]|uniref:sn-1-specific diacylglycerol lipase n=1 Tax=Reticulomyxa filosa TaxID=46433 RepID=X6LR75_RETFI|nr:sn1-specific diacylglycerol lipase beta [Reticulomyxa filosa]|eukprot:ETO03657.1 sn1-specific diacylglycerol lipase beta [Reticulomyxa filosa]
MAGRRYHVVTHYVNIDHEKKAVVISIRGTMSISNTVTDGQCMPVPVPEIPTKCWCHSGIYQTSQQVLRSLNGAKNVINFLEQNTDYGLIINGHRYAICFLGAGVTVVLAEFLQNGRDNVFHKSYRNRPLRAFAFAPPPVFDENYCRARLSESEKYLCCFIHSKDVVPRLSWRGLVKIRASIPRLLQQCIRTQWWVYQASMLADRFTIKDALVSNSGFINGHDSTDESMNKTVADKSELVEINVEQDHSTDTSVQPTKQQISMSAKYIYFFFFLLCVNNEPVCLAYQKEISQAYNSIRQKTIDDGLVSPDLWDIKMTHLGRAFHICIKDMQSASTTSALKKTRHRRYTELNCCQRWFFVLRQLCVSCWCHGVVNCLCCTPCYEHKNNNQYIIYRCNPFSFSGRMLVSGRDLSDHMPHVYQHVLQCIDIDPVSSS